MALSVSGADALLADAAGRGAHAAAKALEHSGRGRARGRRTRGIRRRRGVVGGGERRTRSASGSSVASAGAAAAGRTPRVLGRGPRTALCLCFGVCGVTKAYTLAVPS